MPLTIKRCLISPQKTTYTSRHSIRLGSLPDRLLALRSANFFVPAVVKPLGICEIPQSDIGDLSTWHRRTTALSATTAAFTTLQDAPLSSSARNGPSPPPSCSSFFGESPAPTFTSLTPGSSSLIRPPP